LGIFRALFDDAVDILSRMSEQNMFSADQLIPVAVARPRADAPAAPRLRRPERAQVLLRPVSLEQLLPPEHPARMVWAAVQMLDWSKFEQAIAARGETAGRPATDPRVLAAVWLQGMIDNVGSGRQLEELCQNHATYQWICGGLSINYHSLNDFRTGHPQALDELFTQVLGRLMHKGLVSVGTVTQDSLPLRASAGARSFVTRNTLEKNLAAARDQVKAMGQLADESPAQAAERQRVAQERTATRRYEQLKDAMEELTKVEQAKARQKNKPSKHRPAKASTTDPEARIQRMPDQGYRPAHMLQLAQDPLSRAIVGVAVGSNDKEEGPRMREQVQQRTGEVIHTHIFDSNYVKLEDIDNAAAQGVTIIAPVRKPQKEDQDRYAPRKTDSEAVAQWRQRMNLPETRALYNTRASTAETVNADLKTHRGLGRLLVRGTQKVLSVALWSALAYNLMHFGAAMIG
jgi:transposase